MSVFENYPSYYQSSAKSVERNRFLEDKRFALARSQREIEEVYARTRLLCPPF